MAYRSAPSSPLRRSPRHASARHLSLPPRNNNDAVQQIAIRIEIEFPYHRPRRLLDLMRIQSGPLYFRTLPAHFDPFANDGLWSFSPSSGISRTSTIGREVGDIHFSLLPGTWDATFYVCVPKAGGQTKWEVVERGAPHPLYPSHVLYQRGRFSPRWILIRTFKAYARAHLGNLSVFNE